MPDAVLGGISEQTTLLETILGGCILDDQVVARLEGQYPISFNMNTLNLLMAFEYCT